jgi:hypothetical protein
MNCIRASRRLWIFADPRSPTANPDESRPAVSNDHGTLAAVTDYEQAFVEVADVGGACVTRERDAGSAAEVGDANVVAALVEDSLIADSGAEDVVPSTFLDRSESACVGADIELC